MGIEVARNSKRIYLCQRKYVLDIIAESSNLGSKSILFAVEQNHKLATSTSPLLNNGEQYRGLVGRLIYLSFTRPDLAYSVQILSQFLGTPGRDHWDVAIRVIQYLKGCSGQGILLRLDCDLSLSGWCDLDRDLSLSGWCDLDILPFRVKSKSKLQSLDCQLKQSIGPWLL